MASLKERNGNYSIRFTRSIDGKKERTQFSLKTTRKKVAEKHKRNLEIEQESGTINVFDNFDFIAWRDGEPKQKKETNRKLLSQVIEEYLADKPNLKDKTIREYRTVLEGFNRHVGETMFFDLVQKKDIQDFCFRSELRAGAQNSYLRKIKAFFSWVEKKGIGSHLAKELTQKKEDDELKDQIIPKKELEQIIASNRVHIQKNVEKGYILSEDKEQRWFEPMVRTAYHTGLRKGELLSLKWKHLDLDNYELTVVAGKGGKSRTVIIDKTIKKVLSSWKKQVNSQSERYVFESPDSDSNTSMQLYEKGPTQIFRESVDRIGLSEAYHFHSLRHTAATNFLKAGYNIYDVKEQLGHSSISVTEKYIKYVPKDRKEKAKRIGLI